LKDSVIGPVILLFDNKRYVYRTTINLYLVDNSLDFVGPN